MLVFKLEELGALSIWYVDELDAMLLSPDGLNSAWSHILLPFEDEQQSGHLLMLPDTLHHALQRSAASLSYRLTASDLLRTNSEYIAFNLLCH